MRGIVFVLSLSAVAAVFFVPLFAFAQAQNATVPAKNIPEMDPELKMVSGTLMVNLSKDFKKYKAENTIYAEGFAGYMLKRSKMMRVLGASLLFLGVPLAVAGGALAFTGVGMMNTYGESAATWGFLMGGVVGICVGVPLTVWGSGSYKKGKRWTVQLNELISYRHRTGISPYGQTVPDVR